MDKDLSRIREVVKEHPADKVQNLACYLNFDNLNQAQNRVKANKATGVDKVTKEQYMTNSKENLDNLIKRMKSGAYKPQPSRRVYIPKANGGKRPLGIPSYEDKIVQVVIADILSIIYEDEIFLDNSYGFRPNKNQHQAITEIMKLSQTKRTNYVLDIDIKGFFDNVNHEWMIKFLEHRIADKRFIELIGKFLKAGIMEEGNYYKTDIGQPQGGVISPILSNIYLHYVLDLWFEKFIKVKSIGECYLVRFADDFICLFQYENEAKSFLEVLSERMNQFGLELSQEKTKMIEFGRFAWENRNKRGLPRPESFNFLGFTFYCSFSRQTNKFILKVKTEKKRLTKKIKEFGEWFKRNRHKFDELIPKIKAKLHGHYNYYGVTYNFESIKYYYTNIMRKVFKWLNRRSQKRSFNWKQFQRKWDMEWLMPKPVNKVSIISYTYS